MKGCSSICCMFILSFGSLTKILLMKSFASDGTATFWKSTKMYRKLILALFDSLQSLSLILGLERRLAEQHGETDDSNRPEVHFVRVTERTWHDLRCQVVQCPTNTDFLLIIEFEFGGFSEITHFDLHVIVEKDVGQFEVSVDDLVLVHVLDGFDDLGDELSGIFEGNLASFFHNI